jgi:DNA-binding LytR/AlgR family response regulator
MITIFLCDDNIKSLEKYSDLIVRTAQKNQIDIALSVFTNGESLLFHLSEDPDLPDIIYLDVVMDGLNGIDTAKKLREFGSKAALIFLTTIEDYVFDAFDALPMQYLIKDETTEVRFEEVLLRAVGMVSNASEEQFVCKAGASRKIIPLKDISYFEIWQGVITVYYGRKEEFKYWMTMEDLENELREKSFVRTHRSYIVNLRYISNFQRRSLMLKTGESIPVGVTFEDRVKAAFAKYIVQNNVKREMSSINPHSSGTQFFKSS